MRKFTVDEIIALAQRESDSRFNLRVGKKPNGQSRWLECYAPGTGLEPVWAYESRQITRKQAEAFIDVYNSVHAEGAQS